MEVLKPSAITTELLTTGMNGVPLIVCSDASRVKKKLAEAEYQEIKINKDLAKKLLAYPQKERLKHVEESFKTLLNYQKPLYITDFEILFDPRYEIDVIKLFCEKARIINLAVKWPGTLTNGKLIYADPGAPDYHEYDFHAYQIRIVQ